LKQTRKEFNGVIMSSDEYADGAREDVPLSRKIGRLKTPRITDVALGADVKPDIS
jgi:hypothetical protein